MFSNQTSTFALYKDAQQAQGAPEGVAGQPQGGGDGDSGAVDADFKVVDDDKK